MHKAYLYSVNKQASLLDQWDYGFLEDFFRGNVWKTPDWKGFMVQEVDELYQAERAVVAIPARHNAEHIDTINEQLQKIEHVVLFLMGDEEAVFPVEKINHPSIYIWVQNPHIGKHDNYSKLGTGFPYHMYDYVYEQQPKSISVTFMGQVTHPRRQELVNVLEDYSHQDEATYIVRSKSFTGGISPQDYYHIMSRAKIAPAPSGAVIPDSFRLFEALECMALVVADQKTPDGTVMEYWDWLFGRETPFPKLDNWQVLKQMIPEMLEHYDRLIQKQTSWYIKWKRDFAYKVMEQLNA